MFFFFLSFFFFLGFIYIMNYDNDVDSVFIKEYTALAVGISRQYSNHPVVQQDNAVDREDITQLAMIGLMIAIRTHSADKGPLGPWIRRNVHSEIATWLRDFGCVVKIPRDVQGTKESVSIESISNEEYPHLYYENPALSVEAARKILTNALKELQPNVAKIIGMRWGIPNGKVYKMSEISAALRIHKSYVHRTFNKTMKNLKNNPDIVEALRVIS